MLRRHPAPLLAALLLSACGAPPVNADFPDCQHVTAFDGAVDADVDAVPSTRLGKARRVADAPAPRVPALYSENTGNDMLRTWLVHAGKREEVRGREPAFVMQGRVVPGGDGAKVTLGERWIARSGDRAVVVTDLTDDSKRSFPLGSKGLRDNGFSVWVTGMAAPDDVFFTILYNVSETEVRSFAGRTGDKPVPWSGCLAEGEPVSTSESGRRLAVGRGEDKALVAGYDLASGRRLWAADLVWRGHRARTVSVDWSPDDRFVRVTVALGRGAGSGDDHHSAVVLDGATGEPVRRFDSLYWQVVWEDARHLLFPRREGGVLRCSVGGECVTAAARGTLPWRLLRGPYPQTP